MGMFDTFEGKCPSCSTPFHIQTKQFVRLMKIYQIGSKGLDYEGRLGLKEKCGKCRLPLVAVIENKTLIRYDHDRPDFVEGIWGGRFGSDLDA